VSGERRRRVAFLARSLDVGGAERQLVLLATKLDRSHFEPAVFCFYPGGKLEEEVRAAGVPLVTLGKSKRWDVFGFLFRVVRELRRFCPDVLYTFLPVPNILGVAVSPLLPKTRVVWGIRSAYRVTTGRGWFNWLTLQLERLLSPFAPLIIANSEAARANCDARGYTTKRLVVVPNGVNTERFRPDAEARERIRAALEIAPHHRAIGIVARLDPVKDHETFLRAAAKLQRDDVRFVIIGDGPRRPVLEALARELGVEPIWLGMRHDVAAVTNALDIATNTSRFESFPNAILEAMACGVPVVATDAGDARAIVGELGVIVPASAPEALADAWSEMLTRLGTPLSEAVRARVVEQFSQAAMVSATEDLLINGVRSLPA
jgi:glycosyltransferase involved in cell wall biosynthesis